MLKHLVRLPLVVLPRPNGRGELAEVDFRVEVSGKVAAMAASVHVDNVYGIDCVKVSVHRVTCIGVDHAGVKADTQNSGDTGFLTRVATLPFVVGIPRRRFAYLGWVFM